MQTIRLATEIGAPADRCFLLSLSIDLHVESALSTEERTIAGVTSGLIGPGERVTWRGRHFGLILTHETLITQYERPTSFQDAMVAGAFHSFVHDHSFQPDGNGGTLMIDVLRFAAPLGILGLLVETLVLRRHMESFLRERNAVIRRVAEDKDETWRRYLTDERQGRG